MDKYIFSIYSSEDYEKIDDVFLELYKHDIPVKSVKDFKSGDLENAISAASAVIFVISRYSINSNTLLSYVQLAESVNKHIIPYFIDSPDALNISRSFLMKMDGSATIPAYEYSSKEKLSERAVKEVQPYLKSSGSKKSNGLTFWEAMILIAVVLAGALFYQFSYKPKQHEKIIENVKNSTCLIYNFDYSEADGNNLIDSYSLGSGFFIDNKGRIATNYHVVDEGQNYLVNPSNDNGDQKYTATLLIADPELDLAILQINDQYTVTNYLNFSSKDVHTGDNIYVIGFPRGIDLTVSNGIVSNDSHESETSNGRYYLVTAAVSPGNSGGPAIDEKGNVIGIATAKYVDAENVNLVRPISYLAELYKEIK